MIATELTRIEDVTWSTGRSYHRLLIVWGTQALGYVRMERDAFLRSSQAQDLSVAAITSWAKLLANPGHRLYLLRTQVDLYTGSGKILGMLKVGVKNLFVMVLQKGNERPDLMSF